MPAQLLALTDGPSIVLDKPILLLGRHPECDIQIESRKVSRRHCVIAQVSDYLVIRDLESTNGIRINGQRVIEGKLKPGDELTIGSHRYRVRWSDLPSFPDGAMKKELASPVEPDDVLDDDEILESCEEPVALPEPSPPGGLPHKNRPLNPPLHRSEAEMPAPPCEPPLLPDEFPLLPSSESSLNPGRPGAESPSHHGR